MTVSLHWTEWSLHDEKLESDSQVFRIELVLRKKLMAIKLLSFTLLVYLWLLA